jgi:hypothetical protein
MMHVVWPRHSAHLHLPRHGLYATTYAEHLPDDAAPYCFFSCHLFHANAGVATTATTAAASAASNPQQQQQLQRVFAVAGIDDLTFAEPEALPAECSSSGSCGPHLYGMRLSRIEALWGEELKDVIPLAEFPYKGTIVDDGVDFNHGNLRGQVGDSVEHSKQQCSNGVEMQLLYSV